MRIGRGGRDIGTDAGRLFGGGGSTKAVLYQRKRRIKMTREELIDAIEMIKDECDSHTSCADCPLHSASDDTRCILSVYGSCISPMSIVTD